MRRQNGSSSTTAEIGLLYIFSRKARVVFSTLFFERTPVRASDSLKVVFQKPFRMAFPRFFFPPFTFLVSFSTSYKSTANTFHKNVKLSENEGKKSEIYKKHTIPYLNNNYDFFRTKLLYYIISKSVMI